MSDQPPSQLITHWLDMVPPRAAPDLGLDLDSLETLRHVIGASIIIASVVKPLCIGAGVTEAAKSDAGNLNEVNLP